MGNGDSRELPDNARSGREERTNEYPHDRSLFAGNSTVEMRTVAVPEPGHAEVLLRESVDDLRFRYSLYLSRAPRQGA